MSFCISSKFIKNCPVVQRITSIKAEQISNKEGILNKSSQQLNKSSKQSGTLHIFVSFFLLEIFVSVFDRVLAKTFKELQVLMKQFL